MQSVPITTNVVSLNNNSDEVYSMQHYVISLSVTCGMSEVFSGFFNKTDRHDITEILLKVALNTITLIFKQHVYLHLDNFLLS